jgi:hypothetical protein
MTIDGAGQEHPGDDIPACGSGLSLIGTLMRYVEPVGQGACRSMARHNIKDGFGSLSKACVWIWSAQPELLRHPAEDGRV